MLEKIFQNRKVVEDSVIRTCKVCKETKQLNTEFRYLSYTDCYTHLCKDCSNRRGRLKRAGLPIPEEYSILTRPLKKKVVFENKPYRKTSYANRKRIDYKSKDKKKGFTCDLTIEFVEKSLESSCHYCGFPAVGLDRINNKEGHNMKNSVPCCYECNIARNQVFTYEEMQVLGKTIKEIKQSRILINNKNGK